MTFANFAFTTLNSSLLIANILVVVLLLINRWTTNDLFRINFYPLTATVILICLALGATVVIFTTVTNTLPTSPETLLDSMLKFFPRLVAMPPWLQIAVEAVVFLCLLISPIWTCRHFLKGQEEAREHRNNAQKQLSKANNAAYKAVQRKNELMAQNAGLYKGYLYIMSNDKVPKAVKDEFSRRIHTEETAVRQSQLKVKKIH